MTRATKGKIIEYISKQQINMKYFDIRTPVKKMNAWERSLLELKRLMEKK